MVYALCDHMHERQTLSTPEVIVENWNTDVDAMASEHVLVLENGRCSFFHEGFFDYAYARRFAGGSQGLCTLLVSGEQHLFRRAQVRQILLYLRDTDFDRYIADLKETLSSPSVRFHIKQVIFALLTDLSEPVKREWDVLSSFTKKDFSDPETRLAWMTVHRPPWFRLVDSQGFVQQWLDDPDEAFVDQAVALLREIQRELPDRVAELVEPYVGKSDRWNSRLLHIALQGDWSKGRRFFELMLQLIDKGVLDDASGLMAANIGFWDLLHDLQSNHQLWGSEAVGHYFNRRRQLSLKAEEPNPFDHNGSAYEYSHFAVETLEKLASNDPEAFVREVLPFMQAVIEDCALQEHDGLIRDPIWSFRIFQGGHSIQDGLLGAMGIALSKLAIQNPEMYCSVIDPIRESPFETVQYLIVRSIASSGPLFADEGVDHLYKRPERLEIGYSSDSHWASRQLIESISPHCSDEKLNRLETLLLEYYPDWERSTEGRQEYGHAQFTLLSGISESRRSEEVIKRLNEWRRKFGFQEPVSPTPTEAQRVQSPIPEDAADRMSDEHWLSAIRQYDTGRSNFRQDGRLVGGAHELSRVLESEVKRDPGRFAELVFRFPDRADPSYFEAVLRGITDTDLDFKTILRVTERCHRIEGRPLGRYICDPIASSAQEEVLTEALDLVVWYATEDPDPQQEMWRTPTSPRGEPYYGGDILMNGINTNRGRAAEAIARLIENDAKRITYFQPALEKMVQDPSTAVRS